MDLSKSQCQPYSQAPVNLINETLVMLASDTLPTSTSLLMRLYHMKPLSYIMILSVLMMTMNQS